MKNSGSDQGKRVSSQRLLDQFSITGSGRKQWFALQLTSTGAQHGAQ
jgi:hypothetical protein